LDCPITVIHGERDNMTTPKFAMTWRDFTKSDVTLWMLPQARHLFLLDDKAVPPLLDYLNAIL